MRVWWWLCKDGLVKAVASYTFLTILAPVWEIPNGLITGIRRMSFLLQRLPQAAKEAGNETSHSTQMPWLQLIRWEGGQDPTQDRQTWMGMAEGDLNRRKHIQPRFLESCLKMPLQNCYWVMFFKHIVILEVKSLSCPWHTVCSESAMSQASAGMRIAKSGWVIKTKHHTNALCKGCTRFSDALQLTGGKFSHLHHKDTALGFLFHLNAFSNFS